MRAKAMVILAMLSMCAAPVNAQTPDPVYTAVPTSAPYIPPPPVLIEHQMAFPLGSGNIYEACVDFRNTSSRTMTAIRFDFNLENAFHESVAHFYGDREGMFSPGIEIDGPQDLVEYNGGISGSTAYGEQSKIKNCWHYWVGGARVDTLVVTITRVMFDDGTTWAPPETGA